MIGFKTVYDVTTEAEFFVSSATLTDETYDPKGENMYQVDLMPFDEDNLPCFYNVPLMVDYSNGTPEYNIPDLSEYIDISDGSYNFDDLKIRKCISAELDGDMLNIPCNVDKQEEHKTNVLITVDDMAETYESIDKLIEALEVLKNAPNGKKFSISGVVCNE